MNENFSLTGYTAIAVLPSMLKAKVAILKHLESIRAHMPNLDERGILYESGFTDERGFTDSGEDGLYGALIEGYRAILEEDGSINSFPIPRQEGDALDLWFCTVGGDAEDGVPFDAWDEMWLLLNALERAPQLKPELGIYGFGIIDQSTATRMHQAQMTV